MKILAFAGSARKESFNKKLLAVAVSGAREAGAEVTVADLADYVMPLFDQDLEANEGMPATAKAFKQLLIEHDGFLIASPEYNSSISPLLKNTIDWASRSESADEPTLVAYRGKVAALVAASPGGLGGLRGLVVVRMLLENIGVTCLPNQRAISAAHKAFTPQGALSAGSDHEAVKAIGGELAHTLRKLGG